MARLDSVVVVGASLAGLRTVEALRREGYDGRLTWIGEEAHAPYDRPPLSKQLLLGDWTPDRIAFRQKEGFDGLDVDLRLGVRAQSLDLHARRVTLADGATVAYDGLVIATGAQARWLPGAAGLGGVHVLRTLDDALAIGAALAQRPRVVVIGGGFIGLEVAAVCRQRNLDVTLVEAQPAPLAMVLGPQLAGVCGAMHADHGVHMRCGVGVAGVEGAGRVEAVRLQDGTRLPADLVVLGVGVRPAVSWLEGSGLALGDGVLCDAQLATSVPDVVAAGDVVSWPHPVLGERVRVEHWTNAVEQAAAAAQRLLHGPGVAPFGAIPYFWSDQYQVKIQCAGRICATDTLQIVDGRLEDRRFVVIFGRDDRLTGVLSFGRPALLIRYRRLLAQGATWNEALAAGLAA